MSSCLLCGSMDTNVRDSRLKNIGDAIVVQRRRSCKNCGERFSTYEVHKSTFLEFYGASADMGKKVKIKFVRQLLDEYITRYVEKK